ncbi:hypothetical protein GCM10010442_64220 [Kitasatospora kifunensis]
MKQHLTQLTAARGGLAAAGLCDRLGGLHQDPGMNFGGPAGAPVPATHACPGSRPKHEGARSTAQVGCSQSSRNARASEAS